MYARPRPVFVPVSSGSTQGLSSIITCRRPDGGRTGLAFTDPSLLRAAMGADQRWIDMALPALHAVLAPLGVRTIQLDGDRVCSPPSLTSRPERYIVPDMAA